MAQILPINYQAFRLQLRSFSAFFVLLLGPVAVFGQDPLFSQYYAMPMHINPGFAGISYAPHVEMVYRNQWPLVSQGGPAYVTYALSYDQYFEKYNSGFGVQLLADDAGAGLLKTIKGAITYGYQARMARESYLRGGLELGWAQTRYDWDRFVFGDQLDPEFGAISPGGTPYPTEELRPDRTQASYFDMGTGLLFFTPLFNIGISAKHINSPSTEILDNGGFDVPGIPVRWIMHGSARFGLGRRPGSAGYLAPAFLLASQSSFFQANIGTSYELSTVFAGLWYRYAKGNSDAAIATIGYRKGAWRFAYSFDYTLSDLGLRQGGSHELSIGIFMEEVRRRKVNISDCFEAFR
ncbi:MAG: PorP/SprF family type IX secretion system membrane protein [Saprospiraceae bacterium]|jgi:type IX secretion system PorP/SprF family membrane protein|nr:PorP/SprF family type IX secretion system membrane protein [Saprospiraceae bacterium]MBP9209957.1 PorP/SprF family type IX secretion system membrane protein [Saprospiraceae bacterium]MBV6473054.1 hypothetical protein [Saprospiraceae bacterium]